MITSPAAANYLIISDRLLIIINYAFLQVSRPITLKKDGIQTRNRKLASKSKRKRSGMHDFFKSPIDSRLSTYAGMNSGYLHMSQYYGQMGQMSSQFMTPTATANAVAPGMHPMSSTGLGFPLH